MVMKRFHARARGRGARVEKFFSQITIVVEEKREEEEKPAAKKAAPKKKGAGNAAKSQNRSAGKARAEKAPEAAKETA